MPTTAVELATDRLILRPLDRGCFLPGRGAELVLDGHGVGMLGEGFRAACDAAEA